MKNLFGFIFLGLIINKCLHIRRSASAYLNDAEISLGFENHVTESVSLADLFLNIHNRFRVR